MKIVGVLVGHAHYDHLMDVPAVLEKWGLGSATVYGSRTAAHLLRAQARDQVPLPTVTVNDAAGTWRRRGRWLQMGVNFRAMPVHSQHAPHLFGVTAMRGHLEAEPEPPRNAFDWKEGQTFSWLIDVLSASGAILLRIHYQDAASAPPLGWPPAELLRERGVDVALLCAASFDEVDHYPEALVRELSPQLAIGGHWEDFFRDPRRPSRALPNFDRAEFLARLRSALPEEPMSGAGLEPLPEPGTITEVRVCPPAAAASAP